MPDDRKCACCGTKKDLGYCRDCKRDLCDNCAWNNKYEPHTHHSEEKVLGSSAVKL